MAQVRPPASALAGSGLEGGEQSLPEGPRGAVEVEKSGLQKGRDGTVTGRLLESHGTDWVFISAGSLTSSPPHLLA